MSVYRAITRYPVIILLIVTFSSSLHAQTLIASIKPVALLVRAIATDDMQVESLVPAGASPHTYQLRPSDRRNLADADAIFWIGPEMEAFLAPMFASADLAARSHALAADDNPAHVSTDALPVREHDHDADEEEGHNPHVWLDPELARAMVRRIHQVLITLPGTDRQQLDANLARFEAMLTKQETRLASDLAVARQLSLFTYHNAFKRYADFYHLTIQGVLTPTPGRSPGARQLADIQQRLKDAQHPCVLVEPQFDRQHWAAISEGLNIPRSTWDPLATSITPDRNGYLAFQQALADAVLACLPEQAQ